MQAPMYGGWLTDAGHAAGNFVRSTLDITGKALNTVVTRGGADDVSYAGGAPAPAPDYTMPIVIGAGGLLALALFSTKKTRRR